MSFLILVVDDEEIFRYTAGRSLRGAGFSVLEAGDYRQAARLLASHQIDLMLIDIVFPSRINGFAIARIAKMLRRDMRLLYITGYNVPTSRSLGRILRKPISAEELVREVTEALAA